MKQSSAASPVGELVRPAISTATQIAPESQAATPIRVVTPFPAASSNGYGSAETVTEGALARATEAAPQVLGAPTVEALRHAIGSALVTAGHESASQLLGSGAWILDGATLRIEVAGMGKKMLSLTVNAAAEKIIRQELQRLGASPRFLVVPGTGTGQVEAAMISVPVAGSIQEAALANPLVQRAREIFKAEVRSVVDLRRK